MVKNALYFYSRLIVGIIIVPCGIYSGESSGSNRLKPEVTLDSFYKYADIKTSTGIKGLVNYLRRSTDRDFCLVPEELEVGALFHGLSGVGKTTVAHAIAHALDMEYVFLPAPNLKSTYKDSTTQGVRDLFDGIVASGKRTLLVLDELDALNPLEGSKKQQKQEDSENSVKALWTKLDECYNNGFDNAIFFIGITNNIDALISYFI